MKQLVDFLKIVYIKKRNKLPSSAPTNNNNVIINNHFYNRKSTVISWKCGKPALFTLSFDSV